MVAHVESMARGRALQLLGNPLAFICVWTCFLPGTFGDSVYVEVRNPCKLNKFLDISKKTRIYALVFLTYILELISNCILIV